MFNYGNNFAADIIGIEYIEGDLNWNNKTNSILL